MPPASHSKSFHSFSPTKFTVLKKLENAHVEDRLRANDYPSFSETLEFREILSSATDELRRYDDLISSLQAQKTLLQHQSHLTQSLLSPIRKLPPEILGEIFVHHGTRNLLGVSVQIPAMNVRRVCSHWLAVTSTIKSLWSNICIYICVHGQLQQSALSFLHRLSGKSPLTIEVTEHGVSLNALELSLLASECQRWSSFKLSPKFVNSYSTLNFLSSNVEGLPILEHLSVEGSHSSPEVIVDVSHHAKNLRSHC